MHFYIGYLPIVPRGPPSSVALTRLLNDPKKRPARCANSEPG